MKQLEARCSVIRDFLVAANFNYEALIKQELAHKLSETIMSAFTMYTYEERFSQMVWVARGYALSASEFSKMTEILNVLEQYCTDIGKYYVTQLKNLITEGEKDAIE